jgi:hypothetical protein
MDREHDVRLGGVGEQDGAQPVGCANAVDNVLAHQGDLFVGQVGAITTPDELRHRIGERGIGIGIGGRRRRRRRWTTRGGRDGRCSNAGAQSGGAERECEITASGHAILDGRWMQDGAAPAAPSSCTTIAARSSHPIDQIADDFRHALRCISCLLHH